MNHLPPNKKDTPTRRNRPWRRPAEKATSLRKDKVQSRAWPIFFIPGITGKPRCLNRSEHVRRLNNTKKVRSTPTRRTKERDFRQLLLDIHKDRKQAECDREVVERLKHDLENGLIQKVADIQDCLLFYATGVLESENTKRSESTNRNSLETIEEASESQQSSTETINSSEDGQDTIVSQQSLDDSPENSSEHSRGTDSNVSRQSHEENDSPERKSPETTNSSDHSREVDKSFKTKDTRSTDSINSNDSIDSDEESYMDDPGNCYVIDPAESTDASSHSVNYYDSDYSDLDSYRDGPGDCYLIEKLASSDTDEDLDIYEDDSKTTCESSTAPLLDVKTRKRYTGHHTRRAPRFYSTSIAYLSTFGDFN